MWDLLEMKIPNRIALILTGGFLAMSPFMGLSATQIGWHLAIAGTLLVFGFVLFAFNLLGGGDAKLLPAIGLWLGPTLILPYLLWTTLFGGGFALLLPNFRASPLPAIATRQDWLCRLHEDEKYMPYGAPLAAAAPRLQDAFRVITLSRSCTSQISRH